MTTANGKVKRGHSHARHILTKKTHKRKRNLDIDTLVSLIHQHQPGDSVTVVYMRGDQSHTATVVLGSRPQ